MAYLAGQKEAGADGAVGAPFEADFSNFSRQLIGSLAAIAGIALGDTLGLWVVGLKYTQWLAVDAFALTICIPLFADNYHRSILAGVRVAKFSLTVFVAEFASTFLLAVLSKFIPF